MNAIFNAALTLVIAGAANEALGTPPVDPAGHSVRLYTLVIDPDAPDRLQVYVPDVSQGDPDAPVSHGTRSPAAIIFQDWTANPNSNTGWHYHPGIVLATVVEGSIDWYDSSCTRHVHKAGDFFTEGDRQVHFVTNRTAAPARLIMSHVVEKGMWFKIPVAAPPCAASHGLE